MFPQQPRHDEGREIGVFMCHIKFECGHTAFVKVHVIFLVCSTAVGDLQILLKCHLGFSTPSFWNEKQNLKLLETFWILGKTL